MDWIAADWPAPPGVVAGTTTRLGGSSKGPYDSLNLAAHVGDVPAQVSDNRRRVIRHCKLPAEPAWLNQVHGTTVAVNVRPGTVPEADAILTRTANTVCAVMTADCLPVLLASDDGAEVAAAHAGWRGLSSGVLENVLREFHCGPAAIIAWLGPAISQPNFEVGDEVRVAFTDHDRAADTCFARNDRGRWQADLSELARQRLRAAGVSRIYGGDLCTFAEPARFYSYRRDGQCGRMASFVFRNSILTECA